VLTITKVRSTNYIGKKGLAIARKKETRKRERHREVMMGNLHGVPSTQRNSHGRRSIKMADKRTGLPQLALSIFGRSFRKGRSKTPQSENLSAEVFKNQNSKKTVTVYCLKETYLRK